MPPSTPPRQHAQPHAPPRGACAEAPHATTRSLAVPLTRSPPPACARRCAQSHDSRAGCSHWSCTRPLRGPRCRCGEALKRLGPRTAQLRARTRQRPIATWSCAAHRSMGGSCPPPDGRAWEDGWPVSAIPKLVIRSGRALGRRGIPRLKPRVLAPALPASTQCAGSPSSAPPLLARWRCLWHWI